MGRLIDTDRLKEVFSRNVVGGNAYFDLIDSAPPVLTIPDNPTNGDMIKALFPNTIYSEATEITIAKAFIRPNGSVVLNDFYDNWWNAPYKEEK